MPTLFSEDQRKQVFGAGLEDRQKITESSSVQHCLNYSIGSLNLMEGENWFDRIQGVFHETYQENKDDSGFTGVNFDVDGSNDVIVKNMSPDTKLSIARNGDGDNEGKFTRVPCLQARILHHGDKIRIFREKFKMRLIKQSIVLTYDRRNKQQA